MSDSTFTFRVDAELKNRFAKLARARDRSGAQLLRDFMRQVVQQSEQAEHDAWFRRQVQVGLDAAEAGDVVPGDQVEAEAVAWRKRLREQQADKKR